MYTVSPIAFSTGITWFYWDSYKESIEDPTAAANPNDFGGYSAKELFVEKQYENYKEEILQHITMEQYQALVVFKVKLYMKSDAVKKLKVSDYAAYFYRYGLTEGDAIQPHHITSIVLYCHFTAFCSRFSSTFRKLERWEPIESAKCRNQQFYWQSKYFRETVEVFGFPEDPDDVEPGPFFCGVDRVMIIPSFCLRLRGPTSTSKQLEVAMNFARLDRTF